VAHTESAGIIGVRDIVHMLVEGTDPAVGLISTEYKLMKNLWQDIGKDHPTSRDHMGRLIQDGAGVIGEVTGLLPQQIGRSARYLYDVEQGQSHPRGPWDWLIGLRYGTNQHHSRSWDDYLKGK
jgi:hypothetical protein